MGTVTRFEDLSVWQAARRLTNYIYDMSEKGPFARDFGLKGQMQRAAVSIMSNIAEGFESRTPSLFIEYLGRAKGSAGEVRAQLYVALDRGYLSQEEFDTAYRMTVTISRQLYRLMKYLETRPYDRRIQEPPADYHLDADSPSTFNL